MLVAQTTLRRGRIAALLALGSFVVFVSVTGAQVMQSANYKVPTDSVNMGGGNSASGSYIVEDTLGEWSTGEGLTSASYSACAGYQCFVNQPYLTFSVSAGLSAPGVVGDPINLGQLTTSQVTGSDGSSIKSIFVTTETNASSGVVVSVKDANAGLARASAPTAKIDSADAALTPGTPGFGICVFSTSNDVGSPAVLSKVAPYNGSCTKTTGHAVGGVATTPATVLQSTGATILGASEMLVKAAISNTTAAGTDYQDSLIFVATSTY